MKRPRSDASMLLLRRWTLAVLLLWHPSCPWAFSRTSCVSRRFSSQRSSVIRQVATSPLPAESSTRLPAKQPKPMKHPRKRRRPGKRAEIRRLFGKAQALERKGQWNKAATILRDILDRLDATDAHSHLALARLQARRGLDAHQAFRQGTTACPESVHLWQAWAVYTAEHESTATTNQTFNVPEAATLFERALALDPHNAYVGHAYGRYVWQRWNQADQAQALWETALEHQSTAALVCSLGQLWTTQGRYQEARQLYHTHGPKVRTTRERVEIWLAAAWLEERYLANDDQALALLQQALDSSPTSSVARIAYARLEGRRKQRQQQSHGSKASGTGTTTTKRHLASLCTLRETTTTKKKSKKSQTSSNLEDGRVHNAWANMEIKAGRLGSARDILQRGLKRYPQDHSLLQAAGKLEERFGNYTGARTLYSSSLQVQPSAPTLVAYAMLELKQPANGQRDFERVRGLFEEALLLNPRHGPAYNSYGRAVLQQGDYEGARQIFQRGVQASCSDASSVYHGYARFELALGNIAEARRLLEEGIQVTKRLDVAGDYPHRDRAAFLVHTLGMLELNSNNANLALEIFESGIERFGNSSQLLLGAALSKSKLGSEQAARGLFERAVIADEKHAHAWQAWGVLEMRAGNWDACRKLFQGGIKASPRHGALWVSFGIAEGRLGNTAKARELFALGIKNSPNHAALYQAWASLESKEGNYEAARTLISQALTRDKANGSGWLIAAEIERESGNEGLDGLILRRGVECAPGCPELYVALGNTLSRKGKVAEARQVYEQGMERDPMYAPLYHALAELEAKIFNLEGLAALNKRASQIFNADAMGSGRESAEQAWGSKIKAARVRGLPSEVSVLADRIVDDTTSRQFSAMTQAVDPETFLADMSSNMLENGVINQLLSVHGDDNKERNND